MNVGQLVVRLSWVVIIGCLLVGSVVVGVLLADGLVLQ